MHLRTVTFTIVAAAALAAGCSSDGDSDADADSAPATDAASEAPAEATGGPTIQIEGFAFSALDPVAPGTEIVVSNLDGALHTLTADDGSFNTEGLEGGASATIVAPSTPGDYTFVCNIHSSMTGTLTVT